MPRGSTRVGRAVRVLVTGGDGSLGGAVVRRLAASGHEVVVLGRRPRVGVRPSSAGFRARSVHRVHADLTDAGGLAAALAGTEVDAVCHLAARTDVRESFDAPLDYFAVNVAGTLNLLRALAGGPRPTRMVFASTAAVYGTGRATTLSEDLDPRPESPYAESKLAAEALIRAVAATGAIGAVILRCFNLAGAGNRDSPGLVPAVLRVAAGEADRVVVNGDGSAVREYTHVRDAADAVVRALDAAPPGSAEVLNVGTGTGLTVLDIVAAAVRVTGRRVEVAHGPAAPEPSCVLADTRRIRTRLGWTPTRSDIETILRDGWTAWPDRAALTAGR